MQHIQPRAKTLDYVDMTQGLVYGLSRVGRPARHLGITILSEDRILEWFRNQRFAASELWHSQEYFSARNRDVIQWIQQEGTSPRAKVDGSFELILSSLHQSKLADLEKSTKQAWQGSRAGPRISMLMKPPHNERTEKMPTRQPNSSVRRINTLSDKLGARIYLEIGVADGSTFGAVNMACKTGVDPNFKFDTAKLAGPNIKLENKTSDKFFQGLRAEDAFEVIFIDGLHTIEQIYRDLMNCLAHSTPNCALLIDDTLPNDVIFQLTKSSPRYSRSKASRDK